VRVSPARSSSALQELLDKNFDLLALPVAWRDLEVEEGQYNWEPLDRWIEWARGVGKPVVLGPLVDFSRSAVPDWLYVWQHDYDTCRDMIYDHLEQLVARYHSAVGMWNVSAGLNVNDNFQFTPDQMFDLVRMATLLVRQQKRRARTMIEITQPFGESSATQRDALAPLNFIDRLVQEGIRFDAVGVRLLFGSSEAGLAARDLMQISSLLDRYFYLELPVLVTAAGVPSRMEDEAGGFWHDPWTPEGQASWSTRLFSIAMSKPYVESIFWAELYDHDDAVPPAVGLIDEEGRAKPALQKLVSVRRRLRKPLGTGKTTESASRSTST
jgi:GH35 family endo-1,4-beta-xylanase